MTMRFGLEEVADRRALAEELGVRRDADVLGGAPASPSMRCTMRVEPTGIVDLLITTVPGREHRRDLARHGVDEREVGRAVVALGRRHAEEHELGVARRVRRAEHEPQPARPRPSATSSGSPSSRIGTSPLFSRSTRSASMSAQTTSWPRWARHTRGGQADVAGPDDRDITHLVSSCSSGAGRTGHAPLASRLPSECVPLRSGRPSRSGAAGRPRVFDHGGAVPERLPPVAVRGVPGHGVAHAVVEGDLRAPSRARCAASMLSRR